MRGKLVRHAVLAAAALGGMAVNGAQAAAVRFDVVGAGFELAQGHTYGKDVNDTANLLLGVLFKAEAPNLHHVRNLSVGQSYTFEFGTVEMREEGSNGNGSNPATITAAETGNLGVSAVFKFLEPVNNPLFTITGLVSATLGNLRDDDVDYRIKWDDTTVSFGNGGQFLLSMEELTLHRNSMTADQYATLTLLSAPGTANNGNTGGNAVPEPGSLALAGLGLGVAGFIGRRRRQQG